jgi:hypothetical protein
MVLEDTYTPTGQGDSLDQSAPTSDEDPFATSQDGVTRYHIDKSLLRPFPIVGRLLGFNEKTLDKLLQLQLKDVQRHIGRPATQEEVDAFSYWAANQLSISSYGTPLGIATGSIFAYRGAGTFRFPFWQPNLDTFNPSSLAIFKGNRAIMAWHATRLLAYSAMGAAFGNFVFQGYSAASSAFGLFHDERLKGMQDVLRKKMDQRFTREKTPLRHGRGTWSPTGDANPTGAGLENKNGGGGMSDNIPRQEAVPAKSRHPGSNSLPQTETQEAQDTGFALFDDASPTGGQGVSADTAPQQGGSAWDRLRRGGKPIQKNQTRLNRPAESAQPSSQSSWAKLQNASRQEQRNGTDGGESFTVSETSEERERARSKAQKEFDAQVERERQGGQFSDSQGDQKRW